MIPSKATRSGLLRFAFTLLASTLITGCYSKLRLWSDDHRLQLIPVVQNTGTVGYNEAKDHLTFRPRNTMNWEGPSILVGIQSSKGPTYTYKGNVDTKWAAFFIPLWIYGKKTYEGGLISPFFESNRSYLIRDPSHTPATGQLLTVGFPLAARKGDPSVAIDFNTALGTTLGGIEPPKPEEIAVISKFYGSPDFYIHAEYERDKNWESHGFYGLTWLLLIPTVGLLTTYGQGVESAFTLSLYDRINEEPLHRQTFRSTASQHALFAGLHKEGDISRTRKFHFNADRRIIGTAFIEVLNAAREKHPELFTEEAIEQGRQATRVPE